ncbi:Beta-glucosidase [Hortaea werneckii]|nr:Beta-glucosidase [Hortaea werneckii]
MTFLRSALLAALPLNALAQLGPTAAPYPDSTYQNATEEYTTEDALTNATSPPKYPSPWGEGLGDWDRAYVQARDFVSQLTLLEKVNLTTGVGWQSEKCVGNVGAIPRLGFKALCLQDSPLGVRNADYVSAFPAGVTIASTWDRELFYQRGYDMGSEHRDKGVDIQLGPVVGPIGRAPEGGRNWEGFSPDPSLSGIAVAETVKGIQAAGVMACTKHYIANEQEHFRQGPPPGYLEASLSSNIDDITMHELYLWPFADAVRAGTASIMCSYNQINNSYACQNSYVQNYLLKNELGFQGFILSDWQAQHSGVASALAGLDMTMPGDVVFNSANSFWGTNLTIAVLNGTVPQWRLDDMTTRIVAGWYYVDRASNQAENAPNFSSWTDDTYGFEHYYAEEDYTQINWHYDVRQNHAADIRNQAAKGTVLLKNTGALPLTGKEQLTAVFGSDAGENPWGPNGCADRGCDMGTLAMGWGSGTAEFPYLVTPLEAIKAKVRSNGKSIEGITDDYAYSQINSLANSAAQVDGACIVFANADGGEGYIVVDGNEGDRNNLTLWHNGNDLISNVSSYCPNTIVVMHTIGPVLVDSFYENPNVTAIIWAGIPGQESGNSIVDVLYGDENPGGKSVFTWGRNRGSYGVDLLYEPNNGVLAPQQDFEEGVFIDYRAFDRLDETPIYEFGFGLSYTTFSYSNLNVQNMNAGEYTPTEGNTPSAPVLGSISNNTSDYLFPDYINRIYAYIYPYLNSTNLRQSSADPMYGVNHTYPPGAYDSGPQPYLPAGSRVSPGGNEALYDVLFTVTAEITNTGDVVGDEVPQLYISLGGPNDPKVVLRNFDRLTIEPGQTKTFVADINRRDISSWDPSVQDWVVSSYPKTVHVGSSSRKLPLSADLDTSGLVTGGGNGGNSGSSSSGSGPSPTTTYGGGNGASSAPASYTSMGAGYSYHAGQPTTMKTGYWGQHNGGWGKHDGDHGGHGDHGNWGPPSYMTKTA